MTVVNLTAVTTFAPVPAVQVDIAASGGGTTIVLPAGTNSITLWRVSEGREFKVRDAVDRTFSGAIGVRDFEAGFDVQSDYELECFVDGLSTGNRVALGSLTLPWTGDPNGVLIQQPLNPSLSAVAMNLAGSWPRLTSEAPGDLVFTEGEAYPTLVAFGPRRALSGVDLDFGAPTRTVADQIKRTLGTKENPQLPVWLVRAHHGFLPRTFFCRVKALTEVDVNMRAGGTWSRFQAVVDEIAPPAPALVVSPLGYDDLDISFASYTAMDAAFPSYSARDTAWNLAGAAG